MLSTVAERREFLRRVYRAAEAAAQTRDAFLDGLADEALKARLAGRQLTNTSANGKSVQYGLFMNWTPSEVLEIIDWARGFIAEDVVADAVALVPPAARFFGSDFTRFQPS